MGINNKPIDAINISLKYEITKVFPFVKYAKTTFPKTNPIITPIVPNLFFSFVFKFIDNISKLFL